MINGVELWSFQISESLIQMTDGNGKEIIHVINFALLN